MSNKVQKKITLTLDAELGRHVQRAVKQGLADSQRAFFEAALRSRLKDIKRENRRNLLLEASKDPLFLADVEEIEREFAYADAEAAKMIDGPGTD